ncbi:hypothetical protein MKW94_008399 [Papaver nudicaule]|uniref:Rho GTPase-activating protein REN1-like n=1 Tax=Papaver nudicaule TaxID=74823 RepID=A0AA41RV28_PAPNU|nr:hypothetical protein [Papaver nudicaule]
MVQRNNSEANNNQGDGSTTTSTTNAPPTTGDQQQQRPRQTNTVYKSGPLLLSSKGLGGWITWKKRWFILTRTSLVFFRSDPSVTQRGGEVNLTLGGIDLNNSGSVVVREDKKLITVLFPDGRDGRAFTLKAETSEDLSEWKTALESALAQAPSAALVMGQNAIFRNDQAETVEGGFDQWGKDKQAARSLVVGRPILLALEDIDGTPSFLEKALKFMEEYGCRVEGVLRQAADVDDVERRIKEYEQGKDEFSPEEDAHIIADCIKYVLRELPSSPVPAACCNALVEACKTDRGGRVKAMRAAISQTFPEPNRHLLHRILKMMQVIASHKAENRMSTSAVAACMAPLLLRPLLAGDCELENDFTLGGDGSVQLLQAAAAANHAQAICITLLEECNNIFGDVDTQDGSSPDLYSGTDESGTEDGEASDEDEDEDEDDGSDHDSQFDPDAESEEDLEDASRTASESSGNDEDSDDNKVSEGSNLDLGSPEALINSRENQKSQTQVSLSQSAKAQSSSSLQNQKNNNSSAVRGRGSPKSVGDPPPSPGIRPNANSMCSAPRARDSPRKLGDPPVSPGLPPNSDNSLLTPNTNSVNKSFESVVITRRPTVLGRTPAKKNLSMESIDFPIEEEAEIQRLEDTKTELQNKIAKEAKENANLHVSLEKRKEALRERRIALEQDVKRLQDQFHKERELRAAMEAGLNMPAGRLSISSNIDKKTRAELEAISLAEADVNNLKQKVSDLHEQLNKQRETSICESCGQQQQKPNFQAGQKDRQKVPEATAPLSLHESSKQREEDSSSSEENEKVRTHKKTPSAKKISSQKQHKDSDRKDSKKSSGSGSSVEPSAGAPITCSSHKLVANSEDASEEDCERTQETSSATKKQSTVKQQTDSSSQDSNKPGSASSSSGETGGSSLNSKKAGSKIEAAASTSSALSKLTTRLNFLKERRTQIVNELHNIETSRGADSSNSQSPNIPTRRTNSR